MISEKLFLKILKSLSVEDIDIYSLIEQLDRRLKKMDKDKPMVDAIAKRVLENYLNDCMKPKAWTEIEKGAMRRYLIKRKALKRDVQPEDVRDDPDMLRMMVAITKKYTKKDIKKEMAKQIKELGFAREEF